MLIDYVKLNNFRIHKDYYLKIKPDTTLILGANGIGKTSVIEAIYLKKVRGCQRRINIR